MRDSQASIREKKQWIALFAAAVISTSAATGQTPSDDALWRQIEAAKKQCEGGRLSGDDFAAAEADRREILRLIESYLMLYPGGEKRAAAIRFELQTLFEIGVIEHGDWRGLRAGIAKYAKDPAAAAEAEYWGVVIGDARGAAPSIATVHAPASTRPASIASDVAVAAMRTSDDGVGRAATRPLEESEGQTRVEAIRRYAATFREGRHTPELLRGMFEAAERAGDLTAMRAIVESLGGAGPAGEVASVTTDAAAHHAADREPTGRAGVLAARLARAEAVGRPFAFEFKIAEGEVIDAAKWRGTPVLIVVWDSRTPDAMERLHEVDAVRGIHMEVRTVGVNLDADMKEMRAAASELRIAWPQFNDGRGRANAFARQWGVERTPMVFVIDAEGKLVCAREDESWREELGQISGKATGNDGERK